MKLLKKVTAVFLAVTIMCGVGTALPQELLPMMYAHAAETVDSNVENFTYRLINSDAEVEITNYSGGSAAVEIPAVIDGKSVTNIAASAFKGNAALKSVVIPESVKVIGNSAFESSALEKVTINGQGLERIGRYAFYGTKIIGISLPESVNYIGEAVFMNCKALTSIVIPEKVTKFNSYYGDGTFEGCTALTCVTLPTNLTTISDDTFRGCTKLESIDLPESLTTLGGNVFNGCTAFTSIKFPSNLTSIPAGTLRGCTGITSVIVPESVKSIGDSAFVSSGIKEVTINGNGLESIGNFAFNGQPITGIKLPDSVTSIGAAAFMNCKALTSIVIPEKVTKFNSYYGDGTFEGCTALTSVTLPPNLTTISDDTFRGCTKLESIDLPESVTTFGGYVFSGCSLLSSIILPENLEAVSNGTFYGCTELTNIVVPENVTSIGESAFRGCTGITSIIIPESVKSIGSSAFVSSGIKEVTINGNGLESIGNFAFNGQPITGIKLPDNVTSIGAAAFMNCKALTSIVIPEKVTKFNSYYGDGTFEGCTELTSVTLPPNLTTISDDTFRGCTKLESIDLPESVTTFGGYVFSGCSLLSSIILPENLEAVSNGTFYGCTELTNIVVPENVTSIGESAFRGCTGITSIIIPESVKSIGGSAFVSSGIKEVTINGNGLESIGNLAFGGLPITGIKLPDSVTSIGAAAFMNCKSLTSIVIPEKVTKFNSYYGDGTFEGCTALTCVTLPTNLTTISDDTFRGCTKLESIDLPESLTTLGGNVFNGCTAFTSIKFPSNLTSIPAGTLRGCTGITSVIVPESVKSIGDSAFVSSGIKEVTINGNGLESIGNFAFNGQPITGIKLPDSVTSIGAAAFMNCKALTSIVIPEKVTKFNSYYGDGTFEGCTELTSVTLPPNLTTISDDTFRGCTKLESIDLPESVTTFGGYVFSGCSLLSSIILPENLEAVSNGTFYGCTELTNIVVPENVTSIGESAFRGCTGITSIIIPESVKSIGSSAFVSSGIKEVTINGNGLESIGNFAFNGQPITGIKLPDSVTSIGAAAFMNCKALTSIVIPEKVTKFNSYYGDGTFEGCTALTCVTLPPNLTTISDDTFRGCTKLESIDLPESLTTLGGNVFNGCTAFTSIKFPSNLTSIPAGTLRGCTGITSVIVPESVKSIGDSAFVSSGIKEVTINGNGLESIGSFAFNGQPITGIKLPDSVTSIGAAAFMNCKSLTSIVIPEKVTKFNSYYGDGTFEGCTALVSVSLPSGLITISDETFSGCSSLKNITIPEKTETVGSYAFRNCKALTKVTFKNEMTQVAVNAFSGCTALAGFPRPSISVNSLKMKNTGAETYVNDSLGNYNISATNSNGEEIFKGVSGSYIVIDVNKASVGEAVAITLEHKQGKTCPQTVTVTLDSERKASVDEIIVKEKGYLNIKYSSEQKNIKAVVYDANGEYVDAYAGRNGAIKSKYLSGEYDVYILNTTLDNYICASADEYANRGMVAGIDYFVKRVTVEDNQIASINLTETPENADVKLSCMSEYGVGSDASSFDETNYITYNIKYVVKDESAANADKLTIALSDNLSFVSGSLYINGVQTSVSTADRYNKIEISVKDIRDGVITLNAIPTGKGVYAVSANASFIENGKKFTEALGKSDVNLDFVTLNGKTTTGDYSTLVVGVTSAAGPVEIFVNGVCALTVTPASDGKYSAQLTLNEDYIENGTKFDVYAKNSAGMESKHIAVQYNIEKPVIEEFDFVYYYHQEERKMDLTNAFFDGSRPLISFAPWQPFKFEVRVSNSDAIDKLRIVSDKNGEIRSIDAVYQGDGRWRAEGFFNHSGNTVPGQLYVEYIMKSPSVPENISKDTMKISKGIEEEIADSTLEYYRDKTNEAIKGAITNLSKTADKVDKLTSKVKKVISVIEKIEDYAELTADQEAFHKKADTVKKQVEVYSSTVELLESLYNMFVNVEIANKAIFELAAKECPPLSGMFSSASKQLTDVFKTARNNLNDCLDAMLNGEDFSSKINAVNSGINTFCRTIDELDREWEKEYNKNTDDNIDENPGDNPGGDSEEGLWERFTGWLSGLFAIDPSGYVYEAIPENRLSGVTVSIYYKASEDGPEELWNAIEYEQNNSIVTGENGVFAWDVAEGWYRVEAVKDGYETASSEWMYIPPERTDVYIPMYNYSAPEVKNVCMNNGNIEILFSKFMKISTVTDSTVTLLQNGKNVNFTVEAAWDEAETAEKEYTVAEKFVLIPEDGALNTEDSVDVIIDNSVVSYADVSMKKLFSVKLEADNTNVTATGREIVMKFNATEAYVDGAILPTTPYATGCAVLKTVNGTAMLPLRYIAEVNGFDVAYDSSTRKTKVTNKATGEYLMITPGSTAVEKRNASGELISDTDAPNPFSVENGITVGPIRFVCEALGLCVYYKPLADGRKYVTVTENVISSEEADALIVKAQALGL